MDSHTLKKLKDGVCFLQVEVESPTGIDAGGAFEGTGFILGHKLSGKRFVVTCKHLAPASASRVRIEFANGFRTSGEVVYNDHVHDLSFIAFEESSDIPLSEPYKMQENVSTFETVTLIGSNEGFKSYVSSGIVADPDVLINWRSTWSIQTGLSTAGGTSGSPVFNSSGELIGMHTSGTERCSFEMRISVIADALHRFVIGTEKFESGVTFDFLNKFQLLSYGYLTPEESRMIEGSQALIVKDVDFMYDAYRDLLPGDIVFSVNGLPVRNAFHAEKLLNDSISARAELSIKRNKTKYNLEIKLLPASRETSLQYLKWGKALFEETSIWTRRYFAIKEEGVLLSKCCESSPFHHVGQMSSRIHGSKGALITHVNGNRIRNLSEFKRFAQETRESYVSFLYFDYITNGPQQFSLCELGTSASMTKIPSKVA